VSNPILKIDDFIFDLLPKGSLDFDMTRSIGKLDFPGAPPSYQDMGFDEKLLDFSGSIIGDDAWKTSEAIETLHWGGKEYILSYGDIQKHVRIQKYSPKLIRSDRVDYTIHLICCYPETDLPSLSNVNGGQSGSSSGTTTIPKLVDTMDRTYTVKEGDTLWNIAARSDVLGDGSQWGLIAKANGLTDEYSLQTGQLLKLPSPSSSGSAQLAYTNENSLALGLTGKTEIDHLLSSEVSGYVVA
jgi:LysM repeat protein